MKKMTCLDVGTCPRLSSTPFESHGRLGVKRWVLEWGQGFTPCHLNPSEVECLCLDIVRRQCHIGAIMHNERDEGPPAWRSYILYIHKFTWCDQQTHESRCLATFLLLSERVYIISLISLMFHGTYCSCKIEGKFLCRLFDHQILMKM